MRGTIRTYRYVSVLARRIKPIKSTILDNKELSKCECRSAMIRILCGKHIQIQKHQIESNLIQVNTSLGLP